MTGSFHFRRLATAALSIYCASSAFADSVEITSTRDTTLYQQASGSLSNGAGEHMFVGKVNASDDQSLRRALLAFNVHELVPTGATINAVTLRLQMSRTATGSTGVDLHRVLEAWGEGTSNALGEEGGGAASTADDATWLHTFFPTSFWSTAGGDFDPVPRATRSVNQEGPYTWTSPLMVSDVQGWLDDPSSNHGWILIGDESRVRTAKRFDTHEHPFPEQRPTLVIDFTPPGDAGACCLADGSCLILTEAQCDDLDGSFQGIGVACTPDPCPQPTGGCCFDDGSCLDLTEEDCLSMGGTYLGDLTSCATDQCPLEPFVDALPIPEVRQPVIGDVGGEATYDMPITEFQQQLHRDLPPTTVWGYGGSYPGPTIEARTDLPVTVRWINDLRNPDGSLRDEHYLFVDLCPHGPNHHGNTPRTVTHLHGGHVPPEFDGYPEFTELPGEMSEYIFPNGQDAATLWYHDHALGITRLNVYMGLAGFYLIRDDVEDALNLPSDTYEIPLVIQDRTFNGDGSFFYPGPWQDHFFGDTILVNGKVWPYLEVDQGKYRFRVLNGSNSRTYTLSLDDGATFLQIGSDGGLLEAPVSLTSVTLAPAERADIVIDFAGYAPGTEVILENSAPAPFPGSPGVGVVPNVMQFRVGAAGGDQDPIPGSLRTIEELDEADAAQSRDFVMQRFTEACTGSTWLINGLRWDDIAEYPILGTTEIWSFINRSSMMHPMHMHLVFFQVLDRQPFEVIGGQIVPVGEPVPPPPNEQGWKDTVQVGPQEIVRVIARFEGYTGKFAYHCHILEHEDHEMMRQFQVVCRADLAPPFGELDVFDVIDFLGLLSAGSPMADWNGDTIIDIFDVVAFLGDFEGC